MVATTAAAASINFTGGGSFFTGDIFSWGGNLCDIRGMVQLCGSSGCSKHKIHGEIVFLRGGNICGTIGCSRYVLKWLLCADLTENF